MEKGIGDFLSVLCIEWGFCLPIDSIEELKKRDNFDPTEFAEAVFDAEGMNPELEIQWKRKIRNRFIKTFGQELNRKDYDSAL